MEDFTAFSLACIVGSWFSALCATPIKLVLFEELYILIFTVLKLEDFNSVDSLLFSSHLLLCGRSLKAPVGFRPEPTFQ